MESSSSNTNIDGLLTAEPFKAAPSSGPFKRWMILKAHAKHAGKEVIADNVSGEGAARRLAACWNACEGVPAGMLRDGAYREMMQAQTELTIQRDGANERAGLLLKAKDEWAERARAAEEEAIQLRAAISDPESVFVNMKRGTIAKPSLRSMLDLYGEVVNGDEAQLLEIGKLRAEVEMLRSDRKACLEEFKALRRSADETERELRADVEALRHLAGELYQVLGALGALDAPAGVLDAVLAAAHGEPMEGRGSLLPFVSEEHEALRKDAERYRGVRRVAGAQGYTEDQFDEQTDQRVARFDAALAAKEGA